MPLDRFSGPLVVADHFRPHPNLRHVVMDWDGTISLLRGGWVGLMAELCLEHAPGISADTVRAEILALNGKPSIHQMARIAELTGRGTADEYQEEYIRRITALVRQRVCTLHKEGEPGAFLVPGVEILLGELASRGVELTVASGTPLPELVDEAALLAVSAFFGGRLHGPRDTIDRDFSKRAAMHVLIRDYELGGDHFAAIGDGPIEIGEAKAMGGLAVAVAPDETALGSRRFDDFKLRQLLECGADLVVPDFLDAVALVRLMLGELRA